MKNMRLANLTFKDDNGVPKLNLFWKIFVNMQQPQQLSLFLIIWHKITQINISPN